MIRYYCDRCEIEVEGQADLNSFATDVGDIATSAGWRLRRELCLKCLEEAKDLLNKFFAKTTAARRRSA